MRQLPENLAAKQTAALSKRSKKVPAPAHLTAADGIDESTRKLIEGIPIASRGGTISTALTIRGKGPGVGSIPGAGAGGLPQRDMPSSSLVRKQAVQPIKPVWHPPWKLMRVIAGHLGWVRSIAVEPNNQWFCTGAGDRTIKSKNSCRYLDIG